jgi:enediyne biosynthesis protein E4
MRVHFGTGAATKIDWVQIRWPSGLTERFDDLAVDKIHVIREGSGKSEEAEAKPSGVARP